MRQVELLEIVINMEKGQAYKLTRNDMIECAWGSLTSALDGPPRETDIEDFVKSVASSNWGVDIRRDYLTDTWTIYKHKGDQKD